MHCGGMVWLWHLLSFIASPVVASPVSAISSHNETIKRHIETRQSSLKSQAVSGYIFSMPVDYFDADNTKRYGNRYWINDSYYKPGGPVFWFDVGESGVTMSMATTVLSETNGLTAVMQLTQRYNGMAVLFEHRYYGYSQPFPEMMPRDPSTQTPNATPEMYQYLTIEQALEDVVYFANNFAPEGYDFEQTAALAPSRTPWIWLGGSYPGSRGLWIRQRNPEIIYAVWASSPPTETMEDGKPYFGPIEAALPRKCSADVQAVVRYVDEIIDNKHCETDITYLKQLSHVTKRYLTSGTRIDAADAADTNVTDIAQLLALPFMSFQDKGLARTDRFCDFLQAYNPSTMGEVDSDATTSILSVLNNRGAGAVSNAGIVATYNVEIALEAYLYAITSLGNFSSTEGDFTAAVDGVSWRHQQYTEMGWWIASNPEHPTITSKFLNHTELKRRVGIFDMPAEMNATTYPEHASVSVLLRYGGWHMEVSNAMITNGEFDPWRAYSVSSQEFEYNAPGRNITQAIPACGQVPLNEDVFGLIYEGQVHATDLGFDGSTNGSSMKQGLSLFQKALDVWLPCFEESSRNK